MGGFVKLHIAEMPQRPPARGQRNGPLSHPIGAGYNALSHPVDADLILQLVGRELLG